MTVLEEKRILGCVYGGASVRRDFPRLISLIEHGKLDVGSDGHRAPCTSTR